MFSFIDLIMIVIFFLLYSVESSSKSAKIKPRFISLVSVNVNLGFFDYNSILVS